MKNRTMKLKRLRAMSAAEIFYRLLRVLRDRIDRQKYAVGAQQPLSAFVSRLRHDDGPPEELMQRLLAEAQHRTVFPWQKMPRQDLVNSFAKLFPESRKTTLMAANNYAANRFTVFGLEVNFDEAVDWHLDPLSGRRVPLVWQGDVDYYSPQVVREVKYVWELNRCQHFVTLGKAWFLSDESKYAKALIDQWLDWIEKNPYMMGINWTSALECAFRLLSWTWALQFIKTSPAMDAERYARILMSIGEHASFICSHLSKYSSANNHLIGESLGLIYAGAFYPELPSAGKWLDKGHSLLEKEILRQVTSDGVSREQAFAYHRYVLNFGVLADGALRLAGSSLSASVLQRLEKMAEFIAAIMDDSGNIPAVGDDDGGRALLLVDGEEAPNRELVAVAARLYQRADLNPGPGHFQEAAFWLFGDSCETGLPPYSSAGEMSVFEKGGYVIIAPRHPLRQKLIFDCGPLGLGAMAAHGHADALSFTLSVAGRQVITDSGAWLYLGAGEERRYFRSTRAHSTLVVDELDQSEMLGPFQWGRRANCTLHSVRKNGDYLSVEAAHDGYKPLGITHSRRIEYDGRAWVITDTISGIGIHQIDVYFQLAPSRCRIVDGRVQCHFKDVKVKFDISAGNRYKLALELEEQWYSPRFGERLRRPVLRASAKVALPFTLKTRIEINA